MADILANQCNIIDVYNVSCQLHQVSATWIHLPFSCYYPIPKNGDIRLLTTINWRHHIYPEQSKDPNPFLNLWVNYYKRNCIHHKAPATRIPSHTTINNDSLTSPNPWIYNPCARSNPNECAHNHPHYAPCYSPSSEGANSQPHYHPCPSSESSP